MEKKRTLERAIAGLLAVVMVLTMVPMTVAPVFAGPGDVVINEIMKNPSLVPDDKGEWFELYNPTDSDIDIDGWTIEDDDYDYHKIDNGGPLTIPAGGYLVLGNNADLATNGGVEVAYAYPSSWYLGNGGDEVVLLDNDSVEIDRVEYDDGVTFPDPNGASMALIDPTLDNNVGANWCVSFTSYGDGDKGTPGAETDCGAVPPPPDTTIYEIQYTEDPGVDGTYPSPMVGEEVTTQGIVTAFFYAGGYRYTFIQDGLGEWNGLMLFRPDGYVNVGDLLQVTGTVSEYNGLTQIAYGDVAVLGTDQDLPPSVALPTGDVSQEPWESVLVRVEKATVVQEMNYYGEWLVDDGSGPVMVDDLGYYDYEPALGDLLGLVQGPLYYSYGDFKIEPRNNYDITMFVPICEIQGSDQESPYEYQVVTTEGVVTLVNKYGSDMWIQDEDCDGDPATSDGIWVDDRDRLGTAPEVGDRILVTAQVRESQYYPELPVTQLNNPHYNPLTIISSGNPLPTPVMLMDLPNEVIAEGIAFWESLEGMLVSIDNGFVVGPTNAYGEVVVVTETDADPDLGSGYYAQAKQILIQDLGDNMVDYNPERIMIDDSSIWDPIVVIPGDRVRTLTGVLDYTYGNYKIQPIPGSYDVKYHDLPSLPASTRDGPKGDFVVTTFNVENLFDDYADPNDGKDDEGSTLSPDELEIKLNKLALAIQFELELPQIIIVQEVEHQAILQVLGDRVNAAAGTDYQAVSFETSDGRGIEVGFLWDADRVILHDAYQMSGPDVEAWFGPDSPSPGREPIVGVFQVKGKKDLQGEKLTIIGNHLKSKGGDDPLFGVHWPPERDTEYQRKGQASVVRAFVDAILAEDPDALVLVAGDMNDFQFGEPGEGEDHPLAILEGIYGGPPMTNLLNLEKDAERFTYVYDGNSQALDHMLVSPGLLAYLAAVDVLHFNASFPVDLEDDGSTQLRASDHDPLEGRFSFK